MRLHDHLGVHPSGGLSREGVGVKSLVCPLKPTENKLLVGHPGTMGIAKGGVKNRIKGRCKRLFAFVHVCSHLLAFACVFASALACVCLRLLAFARICLRPPLLRPPSA